MESHENTGNSNEGSRGDPETGPFSNANIPAQIGNLLVSNGLISSDQLNLALLEQSRNGGRVGNILVREGFLSQKDLDRFINNLYTPPLGQRLIERGLITPDQLHNALQYKSENGGLLGEALVELGYTSQDIIERNLIVLNNRLPIGDVLLKNGHISESQLESALAFQKRSGGRLGDILLSLRYVDTDTLYRYLATQKQMGRPGHIVDTSQARNLPFDIARRFKCVLLTNNKQQNLLAVLEELNDQEIEHVQVISGFNIEQVLVSQTELESYWGQVYGEEMSWESTQKLATDSPQNSAKKTLTWPQRILIALLGVATGLGFYFKALTTALIINSIIQISYFIMIIFKMVIMGKGASRDSQIRITREELDAINEKDLPVYTILAPAYKEKDVVVKLVKYIDNLDYPKSKLDVRLLLEEDDLETINAVKMINLPSYYTVLIIPKSFPKTKPKACNYGLISALGKYTVIYDAEDRPEPDQLKKAYLAFKTMPDDCACIQAKLNYYNSKQNIVTKWFTQEYSMWFELLLPGVMQLDIPLPLGGSSNHFKTEKLKQAGGWDPFNVTEDADLGVRLFKHKMFTVVLASRTWEEAPSKFSSWIKQRTRWLKGYMQTWLVHMRNPFSLIMDVGLKGFVGFQAMVFGTFFLPLVNPLLWVLLVLWFATKAAWISMLFPPVIYYASLFLLVIGNLFFIYTNLIGIYWAISDISKRESEYGTKKPLPFSYEILKYALLSPLYWVMMSIAAYRAFWQLITKPSRWEKTTHGLNGDKYDSVSPSLNEIKVSQK